jgi:hypothetical protein
VEEAWHAVEPPYADLFAWARGHGTRPDAAHRPVFRPFMLAHPLGEEQVDLADFAAEWKWDGIRVQLVRMGARHGSTAVAATTSPLPFPRSRGISPATACWMENCWCAAAIRAARKAARPVSTPCSKGWAQAGQRAHAGGVSGLRAAV